jgi:hypothetical protein
MFALATVGFVTLAAFVRGLSADVIMTMTKRTRVAIFRLTSCVSTATKVT